jgi:hypothetical protein
MWSRAIAEALNAALDRLDTVEKAVSPLTKLLSFIMGVVSSILSIPLDIIRRVFGVTV